MSTVVCSWVTIAQIAEVCLPQIDKFIARRVFHYQHQRLGFFLGLQLQGFCNQPIEQGCCLDRFQFRWLLVSTRHGLSALLHRDSCFSVIPSCFCMYCTWGLERIAQLFMLSAILSYWLAAHW